MKAPNLTDVAHRATGRTGVLLMNLGSPDAPTGPAIRRYLAQFLGDPRVVELPRALWLPILYLFIVPFRPKRLAHAYGSIWMDEGSPLLVHSKRQAAKLKAKLAAQYGRDVPVELAMTYGNPSVESAIAALEQQGVRRIVVLPLYPQYSGSTTAACFDAVFAETQKRRWMPEMRTMSCYHDHPSHIAALSNSVRRHWDTHGRGDHLLMSFHGVPQHYVTAGDPYYCQCQKTGRLLAEALELPKDSYSISFQSRFGKAPWVQPYTDATVRALATRGVKTLDVMCPGFAADCLETLEEISIGVGEDFVAHGGSAFRYIPALNDHDEHIEMIAGLLEDGLAGWLMPVPEADAVETRLARAAALEPAFRGQVLPALQHGR
ncbi:MAG: ferrochelatase [Gammaproteobacteria bacterium]|nr:ferrochelatase [Gammaproteobacteria bacterium]